MHIEMGEDERYSATGIGIVTFQREPISPLKLKDVMLILGLKKNLIFVAVLEYCGYDFIFNKGNNS